MKSKAKATTNELAMQHVLNSEFAVSGTILSKLQVQKRAGVSWNTVARSYDRMIALIPDKDIVESAYCAFLKTAAAQSGATEELMRHASIARLTAKRIASALGTTDTEITRRAEELEIRLSATELPNSAAIRLTCEAVRVILATGASTDVAIRVSGVSDATWTLRLRDLDLEHGSHHDAHPSSPFGSAGGEEPNSTLHTADHQANQKSESGTATQSAETGAHNVELRAVAHVTLAEPEVVALAARLKLQQAGRDPDEMVPGAYRVYGEADGDLRSDKVRLINGAETPVSAAYRVEAQHIADILALVREALREQSGESSRSN